MRRFPPWDEIVRHPLLWHFSFGGPDAERLVAGRERIYLDRFWNEFAGDPSKIDEATRVHYAQLYAHWEWSDRSPPFWRRPSLVM